MQKHLTALTLAAGIAFFSSLPAKAQLIAYDGFDMSVAEGTSIGNTTGGATSFGWANSWRNTPTGLYSNVSLSYTDGHGNTLATTGGSFFETSGYQQRTMSGIGATTTGTYWISFLFDSIGPIDAGYPTGPAYTRQMNFGLFPNNNERFDVGRPNFASYAGTPYDTWTGWNANGDGSNPAGTPYVPTANHALNPTTFVVMEIVLDGTTGYDNAYVWFNPNLDATLTPGSADIASVGHTDLNNSAGNLQFRINANSASGVYTNAQIWFDELRVGNTFADVAPIAPVPEPASMTLAGLAGAALLTIARRRK